MATIDEDLSQLERDIRALKIEYEQYFGGGRSRPPSDTEWRIELVIKRYADRTAEINFAQRFRYNNLAQTYAKYREIFRKRMRQREEGTVQRHYGAAAKAIEEERAREEKSQPEAARPTTLAVVTSEDLERESNKVKELYQAYLNAKQNAGQNTSQVTFAHFQDFVRRKTQELKKSKDTQVEYIVAVEGDQVRLKARVRK